jgi:FRG domain
MDINNITTSVITTVAELIDQAELFNSYSSNSTPRTFAFRGQPQEFKTLAPSFGRQFSLQSVGTAEIIERRLIDEFRSHYAGLDDRSSDMPLPGQIGSDHDLRCLSVMQHYEIPTRLLDWTSSFWTAVYFACASDPSSTAELWYYDRALFQAQRTENPDLATLMDRSTQPPKEPPFIGSRGSPLIVELDPQITPRMKQQLAHHTVTTSVFSDHALLLYELASVAQQHGADDQCFRRLVINPSCKSKALQLLAEHRNITASTIFPDVVGLGRFLRWQFESLRTMLL